MYVLPWYLDLLGWTSIWPGPQNTVLWFSRSPNARAMRPENMHLELCWIWGVNLYHFGIHGLKLCVDVRWGQGFPNNQDSRNAVCSRYPYVILPWSRRYLQNAAASCSPNGYMNIYIYIYAQSVTTMKLLDG